MTRKQVLALIATIIGSGIVILDGFVVNLALPNLAHDLHASFGGLQWVIDAYLLSLSALILIGGSLGDIFGRKRIYLIGLVGFGVVSLLCGLAPNLQILLALRVLQGVFGALLVPGALAIINTNFNAELRGAAFGHWTAWSSIVTAIGPLVGGYIISVSSWRWIFFINLPLVVVCYLLAVPNIEESKSKTKRSIDYRGAILAAVSLAGITYGLIEGPPSSWGSRAVGALVSGLILGVVFVWFEARSRDPMVRLGLFKSRNFSGVNITTFAMYGGLSGFIFALLIYLQTNLGYSSLQAGSSLLPISIVMVLLAGRMGKIAAKTGSRLFMTFGPLLASLGIFWLAQLHPGDSYWLGVLPGVVLFSLGLAVTVAPLTIVVMSSVPQTESGIASGINNAVTRVAGLIVIAMLGLFGAEQVYRFSMLLCGSLLALAGVISFILIQNKQTEIAK
ncbi:MAG TPA: MFS transporter [Candidatus Saccharimonadales bacterium]|nr:MFS transporter [Candidatus Saccharimonadales bacterium]